jgi:pSer/pThr/pTyr-binding forkhead associated (FHA) protein
VFEAPPPAPPEFEPPPAPPSAPEAPPAPAAPAAAAAALPPGAEPKLRVIRGQKVGVEFPLYEGNNFIGRADEQPVDIDLEDQEPPEKIWCSRQHALVTLDSGILRLEDLNSSNGTYLNRQRVHPGQPKDLKAGDTIQIGTVQLKVMV